MNRGALSIAAMFVLVSCAAALHVVRTIVDVADDACMATFSDPKLDPEMAKVMAGRTARETCNDVAIARQFVDAQRAAQKLAKASLARPAQ